MIKPKHIKIIAPILAAVIIIVVIILATSGARDRSEKEKAVDAVSQIGILNVGLRPDLGSLCTFNTETGEYEGLEKDVIDEIIYRMFGDDMIVIYVQINSKTKDAMIKTGELDLALGASIETSTSLIKYTSSFYTDGSAFLVKQGAMSSQKGLQGKTIAIVQGAYVSRENDDDVTKVEEYLTTYGITADLKIYASYPEAMSALDGGHVDAVCASETYLKLFGKKGMLILPERFLPQEYCVETRRSLETFSSAMSDVIEEMKSDGTIDALIDIWDLEDYKTLDE